jgi:hypothetical protein
MAVLTTDGALHVLADDRRVGGGPCALVEKRLRGGEFVVHGTCILQRQAEYATVIDADADHRLVLPNGQALTVRILKHSLTSCGPEIVRFEGPGRLAG